ncbi:MAG: LptF/LptG family permease [Trueperaceae bacterium]|nr:LptF/LptG family permease [Trueperaceae bacterium]
MKKLDRYLFGQAIGALLFGLLLYSSLAVISVTLPRLQWVVGTPLAKLFLWLLLQMPFALVQTLPIALVLSVILTFGRMATSNELQAIQAGGISFRRASMIFVYIGALLTAAALVMNERVLPETNAKVGSMYWQLTTGGGSGLWRLAAQDISLSGYKLYFASADRATDELNNVRIQSWDGQKQTVIFAERARFVENGLELFDYQLDVVDFSSLNKDFPSNDERLKAFILNHNHPANADNSLVITTSESYDDLITRFSQGGFEDSRSISEALDDSRNASLSETERRQAQVLFQRKIAEPFANLSLLLIAVPLSLLYAANRGVAFGLSLIVTLVWYVLFTVGQLLAQAGTVPVWLGVWSSNGLLSLIGIYLLIYRTRKA